MKGNDPAADVLTRADPGSHLVGRSTPLIGQGARKNVYAAAVYVAT